MSQSTQSRSSEVTLRSHESWISSNLDYSHDAAGSSGLRTIKSGSSSPPDRYAAMSEGVVDRKSISLVDLTQMRKDTNRRRRLLGSSSQSFPRLSVTGTPMTDATGIPAAGRSHGRLYPSIVGQSAQLDTSMAILERMAHDSVVRTGLPTVVPAAGGRSPTGGPRQDQNCASYTSCGPARPNTEDAPLGPGTSAYAETTNASSSLSNTLSERMGAMHVDPSYGIAVAESAISAACTTSPSSPTGPICTTLSISESEEQKNSFTLSAHSAWSRKRASEASHANHDFHQLLSSEQEEALKLNMRPPFDEDEDEADDLLPRGIGRALPRRTTLLDNYQFPSTPTTPASSFRTSIAPSATEGGGGSERRDLLRTSANAATEAPGSDAATPSAPRKRGPTMAAFQTWRFPCLGRVEESPFTTPVDETLTTTTSVHRARLSSGAQPHRSHHTSSPGPPPVQGESPVVTLVHQDQHTTQRGGGGGAASTLPSPSYQYSSTAPTASPATTSTIAAGAANRQRYMSSSPQREPRNPDETISVSHIHHQQRGITSLGGYQMCPTTASAAAVVAATAEGQYLRTLDMVCSAYKKNFGSTVAEDAAAAATSTLLAARALLITMTAANQQLTAHSLSLSASGALGRSAGYYSFGHRLSISHPNRQAMPHKPLFLGSVMSASRSHPHRRTSGRQLGSFCSVPTAISKSATFSEQRRVTVPPAVLAHIHGNPLLQSTVFLRYCMKRLQETRPSNHMKAYFVSRPHVPLTAASYSVTGPTPSSVRTNREEGGLGTPQAAATPTAATASAIPAEFASYAFPASQSSFLAVPLQLTGTFAREPSPSPPPPRTSFSENSPLALNFAVGSNGAAAVGTQSEEEEAAGATITRHLQTQEGGVEYNNEPSAPAASQCFYRALTDDSTLVRHVHGIDNIEREVDNADNDLIVYAGMRLLGWLEVVSLLGRGSFGQVFLCKDLRLSDGHFVHPSDIDGDDFSYWNCSHSYLPFGDCNIKPTHNPLVAVKVIKSVPLFESQSVLEAEMMVLIGAQTDPEAMETHKSSNDAASPPVPDQRTQYVVKVLADGCSYGHHCIVMDRYGANLYEYIQSRDYQGLPMYQIRSIGKQIFTALTLLHENCHIIHADIKPENLMLTLDSCCSTITTNLLSTNTTTPVTAAAADSSSSTAIKRTSSDGGTSNASDRKKSRLESSSLAAMSLEGSYITLRATSGARTRRPTVVAADEYAPKGGSFRELAQPARSGASLEAPQPRRVHPLNQGSLPRADSSMANTTRGSSSGGNEALHTTPTTTGIGPLAASLSMKGQQRRTGEMRQTPIPRLNVRLIDFSSSCYDAGPFYSYIQSRYYRAPEVILASGYNSGIDTWSTGCVLAELLLGMPLLPGSNDHHQLMLIEERVGPVPVFMLRDGETTQLFYDEQPSPASVQPPAESSPSNSALQRVSRASTKAPEALLPELTETPEAEAAATPSGHSVSGRDQSTETEESGAAVSVNPYTLLSREEYQRRTALPDAPYTRYFTYNTLQELVRHCPLTLEERRMSNGLSPYASPSESSEALANPAPSPTVRAEMLRHRFLFFDLLCALLNPNPLERPTAAKALTHPFFAFDFTYIRQFALEESA